jgi:hypothetical protein
MDRKDCIYDDIVYDDGEVSFCKPKLNKPKKQKLTFSIDKVRSILNRLYNTIIDLFGITIVTYLWQNFYLQVIAGMRDNLFYLDNDELKPHFTHDELIIWSGIFSVLGYPIIDDDEFKERHQGLWMYTYHYFRSDINDDVIDLV